MIQHRINGESSPINPSRTWYVIMKNDYKTVVKTAHNCFLMFSYLITALFHFSPLKSCSQWFIKWEKKRFTRRWWKGWWKFSSETHFSLYQKFGDGSFFPIHICFQSSKMSLEFVYIFFVMQFALSKIIMISVRQRNSC